MTKKFGAHSTADEILASVDLEGKRFLVTGVSSGLSRALVPLCEWGAENSVMIASALSRRGEK